MQYYREDDSVRQQGGKCCAVCGIRGNKLCGCLTVELREALLRR